MPSYHSKTGESIEPLFLSLEKDIAPIAADANIVQSPIVDLYLPSTKQVLPFPVRRKRYVDPLGGCREVDHYDELFKIALVA
jgi:hypothetical protein